jgi:hypothetical protein
MRFWTTLLALVTGYRGTLTFRSLDPTALLPRNYRFTAADQGVHTFTGLVLKKKGKQSISVAIVMQSLRCKTTSSTSAICSAAVTFHPTHCRRSS